MTSVIKSHRPTTSPERDPSTLSNYFNLKLNHTVLTFKVNFEEKILHGHVEFKLSDVKDPCIALDTSYLKIPKVAINGTSTTSFKVDDRLEPLGSKLRIELPQQHDADITLAIDFETTRECTALQFLDKEATDGKSYPYLFSQCQAIHARSLFPCFDTPAIKSTYDFTVESPYTSLMSGRPIEEEDDDANGVYKFEQPIPIPSYLVAIALGDITKKPIGPRSDVYCEPCNVKACQMEFKDDMENFIQIAEKLIFDYEWLKYDALVLPMSFPYGGMENPNVTFVTPTLITGDHGCVDVLAHELAHSWSGNLVTNCSWEHFWLNEGWTVYLERRIQGNLHGEPTRHFSAIIGWNDLENSIKAMGESANRFSTLVQDLKDQCDPDDAFSTVPYEKGFNLLLHIEQVLGGTAIFDAFIPHYFNKFKYKSLDTYQFMDTLYGFFDDKKDLLDTIDWNTWLYKPGMPPIKPQFDTSLVDQCYALADKWYHVITTDGDYNHHFSLKDIELFSSNQSVVFLDTLTSMKLEWSRHVDALKSMATIYTPYSCTANSEVLFRWYYLQVKGHNTDYYTKLGDWLGTVGRMKFVRPGYVLLNTVDHELAVSYFHEFESRYHPICRSLVKKDLGL
ncbi:putative leukotriene A-4 hydrolase (LTA-4 hydrolase) (Leukotriene A(4) hydrolase) [Scheffersomyces spartinae]|uniref:Leukotriene A(4) hydrolase n=1 Tax=Scheffersomyces spartinae TaxID=45513 RepID=A0A9P7VE99_9ASCO|nr:putative leukotriene A-4 hydrolase (LTA-4 hydrolase) (Leukotriene A(4) hydrolase) [Scheffersomyces spartinae]KAG7196235.1 putative leukotriene A-4 hydrolase (LTA-4 hydrolase) (Leukotriene A(4) hydrolase) [Scheffersomyces spartinae]